MRNSQQSLSAWARQRILAPRIVNGYNANTRKDSFSLKDVAPVLPTDLDSLTPTQRLVLEQALVMATELEAAADSAPHGQVIDRCESFLLGSGRDFLRRVLESTLQARAEGLEKKGAALEPASVARRDGTRGRRPKR
jgi:hypothetical protein